MSMRYLMFLLQCLLLSSLLWASLHLSVSAEPDSTPPESHSFYQKGIESYREGDYLHALKLFHQTLQESPESIEGRYYLAITLAQLGRFRESQKAYNNVIRLAPQSKAAELARQGLAYLPTEDSLDPPPHVNRPLPVQAESVIEETSVEPDKTAPVPEKASGAIDPQSLQMMMLLGSMGGSSGFNPMMIPLMESMGQTNGKQPDSVGASSIPPDVLKTMMMNQMMQNINMFGSDKGD